VLPSCPLSDVSPCPLRCAVAFASPACLVQLPRDKLELLRMALPDGEARMATEAVAQRRPALHPGPELRGWCPRRFSADSSPVPCRGWGFLACGGGSFSVRVGTGPGCARWLPACLHEWLLNICGPLFPSSSIRAGSVSTRQEGTRGACCTGAPMSMWPPSNDMEAHIQ